MNWKEYQEDVADFFTSVGGLAKTDVSVEGARGAHMVDVLVKIKHLGIEVLWIIECKLWKTSVPKEKILTLQQIVQDVGADRGFLMSESGFQAGAIRAAGFSNITLSSLAELQVMASEELSKLRVRDVSLKLDELTERYHRFIPWASFSKIKPTWLVDGHFPDLFSIRTEIFKVYNLNFPIWLIHEKIETLEDFVKACGVILAKSETEIEKVEALHDINLNEGLKSLEKLKKQTSKLVKAAFEIVKQEAFPDKQDKIRIQAVSIMKKIGALKLEVRTYTTNTSFPYFAAINEILLDQLYLDLTNEQLQK